MSTLPIDPAATAQQTSPEPIIEHKVRQGVAYVRVTFPSFVDGKPEAVVNYWADGRVSLGSDRVSFALDRLHRHKTGSSVELIRSPLPTADDDSSDEKSSS